MASMNGVQHRKWCYHRRIIRIRIKKKKKRTYSRRPCKYRVINNYSTSTSCCQRHAKHRRVITEVVQESWSVTQRGRFWDRVRRRMSDNKIIVDLEVWNCQKMIFSHAAEETSIQSLILVSFSSPFSYTLFLCILFLSG